ncbi:MAG: polysaccharide deacetylase family protein [Chloroflexota bacterium]
MAQGRLHLLTDQLADPTDQPLESTTAPRVCAWLGDRRWVYSITFDEALSDLHRFAIPTLREHGVPGHVEVVVGQMGQVRHLGGSSFDGFKHMGAEELRELVSWGWGVGNHSWSHKAVHGETAELELGRAKDVLEDAIGQAVTIYCAPGSNVNMNQGALEGCRRYGYLGAMSITDALNRPDVAADADPLWLNRTFLHHQGYGPFFSEFDPFRNIQHARRERGWIIDYLHCPLERPVHPNKDCSAAQLRERIETVVADGDDVWLTPVEDAVDYRHTRRHTQVAPDGAAAWLVSAPGVPPLVQRRAVTLALPPGTRAAEVDGAPAGLYRRSGVALLDLDLAFPHRVLPIFDRGEVSA